MSVHSADVTRGAPDRQTDGLVESALHVPEQYGAHHAALGVVEDMAVVHPFTFPFIKAYEQSARLFVRNVVRVFPRNRMNRIALLVRRLKEEAVQMQRV